MSSNTERYVLGKYIKERYGSLFKDIKKASKAYHEALQRTGVTLKVTKYGFVSYKLQGDAMIIQDMYVRPQYRRKNFAWMFFQQVKEIAIKAGKRVFIACSEFFGEGREMGLYAIKAADFKHAFDTDIAAVFIRGVY